MEGDGQTQGSVYLSWQKQFTALPNREWEPHTRWVNWRGTRQRRQKLGGIKRTLWGAAAPSSRTGTELTGWQSCSFRVSGPLINVDTKLTGPADFIFVHRFNPDCSSDDINPACEGMLSFQQKLDACSCLLNPFFKINPIKMTKKNRRNWEEILCRWHLQSSVIHYLYYYPLKMKLETDFTDNKALIICKFVRY